MKTLTLFGKTFADIKSKDIENCHGFFKKSLNGNVSLFKPDRSLEAMVVNNPRQGRFVVSASTGTDGRFLARYMYSTSTLTENWLGINGMELGNQSDAIKAMRYFDTEDEGAIKLLLKLSKKSGLALDRVDIVNASKVGNVIYSIGPGRDDGRYVFAAFEISADGQSGEFAGCPIEMYADEECAQAAFAEYLDRLSRQKWVIYSASEAASDESDEGAGYWTTDGGYVLREEATLFTTKEMESFSLPVSLGGDAKWMSSADELDAEVAVMVATERPR